MTRPARVLAIGAQGDMRSVTVRVMNWDGEDLHVEVGPHGRIGDFVRACKRWCEQQGARAYVDYQQVNVAGGAVGATLFERMLSSS